MRERVREQKGDGEKRVREMGENKVREGKKKK
jgi:hypothetical protein